MQKSDFQIDIAQAILEIGAILVELRNALGELSLVLDDWQFEQDHQQRILTAHAVRQLLERLSSSPSP